MTYSRIVAFDSQMPDFTLHTASLDGIKAYNYRKKGLVTFDGKAPEESDADVGRSNIIETTGIETRRIAQPGQHSNHLAATAALKTLLKASVHPSELGVIIVATNTPNKEYMDRVVKQTKTRDDYRSHLQYNDSLVQEVRSMADNPSDLETIIVASTTSQWKFPSEACYVQQKINALNIRHAFDINADFETATEVAELLGGKHLVLDNRKYASDKAESAAEFVLKCTGEKNIPAFDIALGCAGFLEGLAIADKFVRKHKKYALVAAAETLSKVVEYGTTLKGIHPNWEYFRKGVEEGDIILTLFGDGAGAMLLGPSDRQEGILRTYARSDPFGESNTDTFKTNLFLIYQDEHGLARMPYGQQVFRAAVNAMTETAIALLDNKSYNDWLNIMPEDISCLIPHQANIRIIKAAGQEIQSKAGIPIKKVYVNVAEYGNTSAVTGIRALHDAYNKEIIRKGDLIMMVTFATGLNWNGAIAML
ncbi:MAG: 3-oxoacyl-[acyl-carrier-protein] synthase III C-terminal domain-containing protein [Candidatus Woesearchaeota archaeon]